MSKFSTHFTHEMQFIVVVLEQPLIHPELPRVFPHSELATLEIQLAAQ